jgi:hypothetical protein
VGTVVQAYNGYADVARALLTAAVLALVLGLHPRAEAAASPNAVARENALPGTSSWLRPLDGDVQIYGSEISAAPGDLLEFHVSTPFRYRILVYRIGWYEGAGARLVACTPSCSGDEQGSVQLGADGPTAQPLHAHWPVTDVLPAGLDWTSGYYLVEAEATTGSGAGHVGTTWVIIRQAEDVLPSQILVQVPVNTWEAYNSWGGNGLYTVPRASRVSFGRPFDAEAVSPLWWEIQLVRFLEREGYDVSYQTDLDTNNDVSTLVQHRLVIVAGHDEYWTLAMRDGFDSALAAGTNLAFTGSNDAYWNIRYEDEGQTIVTYKSLYDPNPDPAQKTAMFRELGRPECLLEGVQHADIRILDNPLDYTVTAAGATDPWLAGTGLAAGDRIAGVVGREHDALAPYPGCAHPGQTVLFHYDGAGDLPADAVKYTAPSGARVFASGAQEFSWALDGWRSDGTLAPPVPVGSDRSAPADPRVQQFMRNALDDLTRPAAPVQVLRHRIGDVIHVWTGRPADVRVTARLIYRQHNADAPVLVCANRGPCLVPRATEPGTYRFIAEFVDAWGRASAPAYSSPWATP